MEKDSFGHQKFSDFVARMRILSARGSNENIALAYGEERTNQPRVRNDQEKLNYIFVGSEKSGRYGIRVKPDFVMVDGKWQNREGAQEEEVLYVRDPKIESIVYAQKMTHYKIRIPPALNNFTSFVDGSSISVFRDEFTAGLNIRR